MKKIKVGIIIGIMLMLGVNFVGASIESSGVMYKSKTLNTVLDDLYSKIEEINSTGDASASDILIGKTALVKGNKITGSMANKSGATTTATKVTESGNNALITIPSAGYYDTNSKISVPIETIKNNVPSIDNTNDVTLSYTFNCYLIGYRRGNVNYLSSVSIKNSSGTVIYSVSAPAKTVNINEGGGWNGNTYNITLVYGQTYIITYTLYGFRENNSDKQSYFNVTRNITFDSDTYTKSISSAYSGTTNLNYTDGGSFPSKSGSVTITK